MREEGGGRRLLQLQRSRLDSLHFLLTQSAAARPAPCRTGRRTEFEAAERRQRIGVETNRTTAVGKSRTYRTQCFLLG